MRDFDRIHRICEDIEILWEMFPDMRLGQLIENFVIPQDRLFFQEDNVSEMNIRRLIDYRNTKI